MRRKALTRGWTHAVMTAAMAYAFVLQALLLSFGGALNAGAAQAPQAILCLPGSQTASDDRPPADAHHNLCCILGCHGSALAGPLPAPAAPERIAPVAAAAGLPGMAPALRLASNVLPVGARAPPSLG